MCFLAYLKFIFEYFKIFKAKRGNLKIPSWGIGVFWKWKKLTAGLIPIYNGFGHKRCIESRLQITYLADLLIWPIDPTPRFFFKILVAMSGSGQLWSEVKLKHKYITVSKASKSRRPQFSHPFFLFCYVRFKDRRTKNMKNRKYLDESLSQFRSIVLFTFCSICENFGRLDLMLCGNWYLFFPLV